MARPRIAVLLPVRQARRTLPSALSDVLAQRDVELTVFAIVDAGAGGEDDGSAGYLGSQARSDSRLAVLRGPGRGAGAALDVGLAAAVAAGIPLLAHMEADDRCPPDRLARLAAPLELDPSLQAMTCRAGQCGARTPGMQRYLDWQNSLLGHDEMARERFIEIPALHQTGLYRTPSVAAVGGYAPRGPWPADIDFWLRWFEHDARVAPLPTRKLPRVLYQWRQHARQSTRSHGASRGQPGSGAHGLDALRAAKVHYLARWLRGADADATGGDRDGHDVGAETRGVILISTGRTLLDWQEALHAAGVAVHAAIGWRPGDPAPDVARDTRPLVLAAYGAAGVRERLRAALPQLREPHELLFTA